MYLLHPITSYLISLTTLEIKESKHRAQSGVARRGRRRGGGDQCICYDLQSFSR